MSNEQRQAENAVQQSDAADVTTSTPTCSNTLVERSFFVLTYAGQFMDSNLLSKGLYATDVPKLFSTDTSIELLIQQGKTITDMMGNEFIPSSYFNNLAKCKLTEVVVSFAE